jgi:ATP-dependent helicase/DNAse subunit B
MAEGKLPPPVADNPVIDFYERARLAERGIEFEEAAEVARWSALSFYFTLLAAAESITLSFPVSIENQQKIPSAYFARLGLDPAAASSNSVYCEAEELRQLLRSDAPDDGLLTLARRQLSIEAVRESVAVADEYDGVTGIAIDPLSRSWSASQFTVLGQCPYRWFAQKVLELKEAEEADTSLSPATKGNLYHKTLELAVERSRNAGDLRSAVLDVLEDCFNQAEADPNVGLPALENWPLQRSEHLKALRKAISSSKFFEVGSEVVALEERFETVWNGITISGRVDRVDRGPGGLAAIDYKTSSAAPQGIKDDKGKSKVDIQLALYAQVALPHLYPGETVQKGLYYSLTKGKVLKTIDADKMPPLEDTVNKMHSLLHQGRFAVDPDTDFNACKYCEFDAMCRKGTRLARKNKSDGPDTPTG